MRSFSLILSGCLAACAPITEVTPSVVAVDAQYCDLLTHCWGLYDSVAACMVDQATYPEMCPVGSSALIEDCVDDLVLQTELCIPPTDFVYPEPCSSMCGG